MNESQATRQNTEGDPCPLWCITDHSLRFASAHVSRAADAGRTWASAVRTAEGSFVALAGHKGDTWADLRLSPRDAVHLAALIEMPESWDEVQALAAAIRQAAAVITDGGES